MTMRGTYLGCVGVKGAVVDVQAERDGTGEPKVLACGTDLGVTKEEDHRDQGTDDHGSPSTPEPARATHEARDNWSKNRTRVVDSIVAPRDVLAGLPKASSSRSQIRGKENIVQRVCQANQEP